MSYGDWDKEYETLIVQPDAQARAANTLLGRILRHPYADSFAFYKVVKVNKQSVRVRVVTVGDRWVLPAWGHEATIKKVDLPRFMGRM